MPYDSTKTGSMMMPAIPKSPRSAVPLASIRIVLWGNNYRHVRQAESTLSAYRVDVAVYDFSRMEIFETAGGLREL